MTEKKARSMFLPVLVIVAVLMVAALALLTLVPLDTCECQQPDWGGTLPCTECGDLGGGVIWDLWGIQLSQVEERVRS